jgi:HK97 family phage major capsid protein
VDTVGFWFIQSAKKPQSFGCIRLFVTRISIMENQLISELKNLESTIGDKFAGIQQNTDELHDRLRTLEQKGVGTFTPGLIGKAGNLPEGENKAWDSFIRTGDQQVLKSMNMATAPAGGAMVPEVIARSIVQRAIALSPIATVVMNTANPGSSDYVRLVNLRGQTASWSSESGTRSDTDTLTLREVRPTHGELYSVVPVTNWLLQDSQFDVQRLVSDNASATFAKSLEAAIVSGDGSNKPTGILSSTPTAGTDDGSPQRAADEIEFVTSTSDLADDLISLFFALKNEYRRDAVFVMSSATLSVVRKLRDSNGSGYLWQQNLSNAIDAPDGFLLGKRVITGEELSTHGTSPQGYPILCGDFQVGYELVQLGGMQLIPDQVTTKGSTKFYISQRFGGRIIDNDAIKVLKA